MRQGAPQQAGAREETRALRWRPAARSGGGANLTAAHAHFHTQVCGATVVPALLPSNLKPTYQQQCKGVSGEEATPTAPTCHVPAPHAAATQTGTKR